MNIRHLPVLFIMLLVGRTVFAQNDARDYVVGLWASTTDTPPSVTLHWKPDAKSTSVKLYRRDLGQTAYWGKAIDLKTTDASYTDNTIEAGKAYEYYVVDAAVAGSSSWTAKGFIVSGVHILPSANGVVILVVDNTVSTALSSELSRLIDDLHAEGYGVIRHDVSRTASVESVKALIEADYNADPDHVTTLFLFGHVPVPYAGDIAPDGHTPGNGDHQGAWSADSYYGCFDGDWTDDDVDDQTASRAANRNVPGDGRFDQSIIPAPMNLEVGRVDLANMPAFTTSEVELLRNYLNKDHAFRTGQLAVQKKALVDINFGVFTTYDVPGEDAWRNFPTLVGPDSIVNLRDYSSSGWIASLDTPYLWAYGCGAGSYNSCSGVGVTADFASHQAQGVFYMVFGSFFGDWDADNDFTRAPLASGNGLASCWVSRPFWFFHPMAAGQTLGYCTKLTMNNGLNYQDYTFGFGEGGVHLGLMGDPTLRQDYFFTQQRSPSTFTAQQSGNAVDLNWSAVSGAAGYDIYRSNSLSEQFEKLNDAPIASTTYADATPNDTNYYLLRVANLVTTPSATYYADGPGLIQRVVITKSGVSLVDAGSQTLHVGQTDREVRIDIRIKDITDVDLTILDPLGRKIMALEHSQFNPGSKTYVVPNHDLASGLYFARLRTSTGEYSSKIMIAK